MPTRIIKAETSQCSICLHLEEKDYKCKAFLQGIPKDIVIGLFNHTEPYSGDNGIQFTPEKRKGERRKP